MLGAAEAIAIEPRWGQVPAWCALEQARCAVLDGSVTRDLVRYPEVIENLVARTIERPWRPVVSMAIVHQPRVDVRLQMTF